MDLTGYVGDLVAQIGHELGDQRFVVTMAFAPVPSSHPSSSARGHLLAGAFRQNFPQGGLVLRRRGRACLDWRTGDCIR